MLKAALFSDGTKEYRIPEEPECGEKVRLWSVTPGAGTGVNGWNLKKQNQPEDSIFMRLRFSWGRPR